MKTKNQVKLEFPSIPENVALARVIVATMLAGMDFTLTDLDDAKVAVSEAVSNAILHGYQNRPNGLVYLTITADPEGLEVIVEDYGRGIVDVAKAMEPAFSTLGDRMGMGFVFMQSFMDKVDVDSQVGRGTRVRMYKACRQAMRAVQ
ncbi:anti-sigma F factor [Heliobacterium undosum]|uniref:Anti-sigma F factor n=2 Tax=Heliomicrobium TaxID=2831443 RepID=B0TEM0_HELMI|nr:MULTISPECIES: anti-sigma F factor [Heliomicrobium]ABZ82939.1 anti-sigma f factor [Heliomicrobium modesticaldum Ice1]MZP28419.1 anti-sigma F factor [Heliomicrobium undosum]